MTCFCDTVFNFGLRDLTSHTAQTHCQDLLQPGPSGSSWRAQGKKANDSKAVSSNLRSGEVQLALKAPHIPRKLILLLPTQHPARLADPSPRKETPSLCLSSRVLLLSPKSPTPRDHIRCPCLCITRPTEGVQQEAGQGHRHPGMHAADVMGGLRRGTHR